MGIGHSGVRKVARTGWLAPLILMVSAGILVAASPAGLHFERVGSVSGPPSEVITALHQDRTGFIWIGSRDGLALYDGYSFTHFEHDPSDPYSISGNTIRTIYEDGRGNMWFGTNTGGLNRLDRTTWHFEHFRHDSADPRSISHDSVYAILEDRTGALWVGTQQGLNRLDASNGAFERFLSDPDDPRSLSHDYVYGLYEDRAGGIWVSTFGGGLNVRDPDTGAFTAIHHDPDDPSTLSTDFVLALAEDASGNLWVASNDGLNRFDRANGSFRRFMHDPGDETGLSDPLVTSLAPGPPGKLWVGTHGGGLNQLDTATGRSRTWRHDPFQRHGLSNDEIIALLTDSSGALWVGTWGGGLNRLTGTSLILSASADKARMPEDLEVNDVTALMHDSRGGLWIGTRAGDVVRRDLKGMTDERFLRGGALGTPRIILHFAEDHDGRIWVGTNGGIVRLGPEPGAEQDYVHDPQDASSLGPGYVKVMLVDTAGTLWIGTGEGGLQRLDGEGRVRERFLHDPDDSTSLSDDYVTALYEDGGGTLWVGTRSGGLNAFDRDTGRAVRYLPDPGTDGAIGHHYVTSIVENAQGTLWVGTGGGGLNRADPLDDGGLRFARFTQADGLIDDDVMAALEDDDGSLWLSTKRGLTRFDPESGSCSNFFVADGLPSGEFEPGATALAGATLYFGSVKGLVAVPAGTQFPGPAPSPTVIRSIRNGAGELRGDLPAWELDELTVPWGDWFSLEFAVLDYNVDRRHRYRYRVGDAQDWVDLRAQRQITFTDLDPGIHDLSVQGRNSQGVWSTAAPTLRIRVIPPFWMTWWFRASMLLAVVALAIVGHRVRMATLMRRNRELEELHEARERARRDLGQAYERLRRLTRRLEAVKEDERKHLARELHDEMGPTLTAVIINLQLMAENHDPDRTSQKIADTVDLVDRMIQRIRDLSLDLRPPLLDELGLVAALGGYIEGLARRAGVDIEVSGKAEGLPPEIEITAFRLVQEAVTNVIRHADAKRATVAVDQRDGKLELAIRDDGSGFDVPDAMDRAASGTALGLLGMQERVQILGGEIEIDSGPGKGTGIRISLPVEDRP
jgi:signal transduction histidine kinase/ligand-binding sensor domain-containing protein